MADNCICMRLRDAAHPGAVLQALSQSVEVLEFLKVRPTMESLFIEAVNATQTEVA